MSQQATRILPLKEGFWFCVLLFGISVTRIPFSPEYLSLDDVNLAFALEQFDPWSHQPHPPGYPLFVGEARLVNLVFKDARNTFVAISVIASTICLALAALVGGRMFSPLAGRLAALLLLVNPTFWFASLESPLRPHLALFSLLVGYCCWRAWNGEKSFTAWGALALGIGCGFRPDLIVYLLPVWLVSSWRGCRVNGSSAATALTRGFGIIFGFLVLWTSVLAWGVGGLDRLNLLLMTYLAGQIGETSALLGGSQGLFHLIRLITWNGIGMLSWLPAIPLAMYARNSNSERPGTRAGLFLLLWIAPGLTAQGVLHAAAPGHTLFSVPVLCLIGGSVLAASMQIPKLRPGFRWAIPALAVLLNAVLFFNSQAISARVVSWNAGSFSVVPQAVADGFFQESPDNLLQEDQVTRLGIREIGRSLSSACSVIVAAHGSFRNFHLLNWRVVSYYFPDHPIWILGDEETPPKLTLMRGKEYLAIHYEPALNLNIPTNSDLVWILDPGSDLRTIVGPVASETGAPSIFNTHRDKLSLPFSIGPFRFLPDQSACLTP